MMSFEIRIIPSRERASNFSNLRSHCITRVRLPLYHRCIMFRYARPEPDNHESVGRTSQDFYNSGLICMSELACIVLFSCSQSSAGGRCIRLASLR